VPSGF